MDRRRTDRRVHYYRLSQGLTASAAAVGCTALLGLWTLVAPWIAFAYTGTMVWSNVVGAAVAMIAAYNAYRGRAMRTPRATT